MIGSAGFDSDDNARRGRAELILALRARGISDRTLLAALESVPRERFVAAHLRAIAYNDVPLPIGCGQTLLAPTQFGLMLQALNLLPDHKVLDVGTGSGFAAAVCARLALSVTTIDRYRTLINEAKVRFDGLDIRTITAVQADGHDGYVAGAPYDRILVTASSEQIPGRLVAQLKPGGVLVMPHGPKSGQTLIRLTRNDGGDRIEALGPIRVLPLVNGLAAAL